MRKFFLILAAASLLAAGCEIKRDGYGFVVSTQAQGTVIDGQQAGWDLRSGVSTPLTVGQPGLQPLGGLSIPQ